MSQSFPLLCVAVIFCAALPPPTPSKDRCRSNDLHGSNTTKWSGWTITQQTHQTDKMSWCVYEGSTRSLFWVHVQLKTFIMNWSHLWSIKKKYWATTFRWKNDHGMSGIVSFPIGDYQTAVCYEIRISQLVVKCAVIWRKSCRKLTARKTKLWTLHDIRSDWRPCPRSQGNKHSLNEGAKDIALW